MQIATVYCFRIASTLVMHSAGGPVFCKSCAQRCMKWSTVGPRCVHVYYYVLLHTSVLFWDAPLAIVQCSWPIV